MADLTYRILFSNDQDMGRGLTYSHGQQFQYDSEFSWPLTGFAASRVHSHREKKEVAL